MKIVFCLTFIWMLNIDSATSACTCINPFVGTVNSWKGKKSVLCADDGPGNCYVNCNGDCPDQEPTANPTRCQSRSACGPRLDAVGLPDSDFTDIIPDSKALCECIDDDEDISCSNRRRKTCSVECNRGCTDQQGDPFNGCWSYDACDPFRRSRSTGK